MVCNHMPVACNIATKLAQSTCVHVVFDCSTTIHKSYKEQSIHLSKLRGAPPLAEGLRQNLSQPSTRVRLCHVCTRYVYRVYPCGRPATSHSLCAPLHTLSYTRGKPPSGSYVAFIAS